MSHSKDNIIHTVIVGAGPYGLSLAAHLREKGVPFRIFGQPMQSWATQMPEGMKLKSDGFASNLSAGSVPFTLEDFCNLTGREYHATQTPVALEDFVAYGREFARRLVPTLETVDVAAIEQGGRGGHSFRVRLENGENFLARHVVLATGIGLFPHVPETLATLGPEWVTHSIEHRNFDEFADRDVTVLGRGASSLNAAALLHEAGARVTVLSRKRKIHVHTLTAAKDRSVLQRVLHPSSPLGSSMRSWMASRAPGVFHALPQWLRKLLVYKHLGPAGGTALRGRVVGKVPLLLGWSVQTAELLPETEEQRIRLTLVNAELETREHRTSHLIAGTGFRVDVARMRFLSPTLIAKIRRQKNGAPVLNRHFQSSVAGLYFIGPAATASFGPLLRFAAGSGFAAGRVAGHLRRDYARLTAAMTPELAETQDLRLGVTAPDGGQRG